MANKYFPLPQLLKYFMLIKYLKHRLRHVKKSLKLDLRAERASFSEWMCMKGTSGEPGSKGGWDV